jgi:hypothetical protein
VSLSALGTLNDQLGVKIKAIQDQMTAGGIPHPDDIKALASVQEEMAMVIAALEPGDPTVAPTAMLAGAHS